MLKHCSSLAWAALPCLPWTAVGSGAKTIAPNPTSRAKALVKQAAVGDTTCSDRKLLLTSLNPTRGRQTRRDLNRQPGRQDVRGYLKVGCEVCIAVALADQLSDLPTKNVVHNAGALLKVVKTRQQGLDRRLGVLWVQLLHLLIRHVCQGCEQLSQVAAHVGIRAVPHSQAWNLGKTLQQATGTAYPAIEISIKPFSIKFYSTWQSVKMLAFSAL